LTDSQHHATADDHLAQQISVRLAACDKKLASYRAALDAGADPTDRAEVYRQLGLKLTYHPEQQKVRVQAQPDADSCGEMVRVRRSTQTNTPRLSGLIAVIPLQ
jgi:hypothetical protein